VRGFEGENLVKTLGRWTLIVWAGVCWRLWTGVCWK